MYYGYKHWTLEETPRCFYVGKGRKIRPYTHQGRNHKWHAVVKRYGLRVEVCVEMTTNDEICAWEIATIALERTLSKNHSHDDSTDIGCNFTRGGNGKDECHTTAETRAKQSASQRRRFAEQGVSDVTRQKLSLLFKGRTAPNKGRSPSDETRARMCKASSGANNGRARLTEDDVRELRQLWSTSQQTKWSFCRQHAARLNVTPEAIYGVITNKTWRNVKPA